MGELTFYNSFMNTFFKVRSDTLLIALSRCIWAKQFGLPVWANQRARSNDRAVNFLTPLGSASGQSDLVCPGSLERGLHR